MLRWFKYHIVYGDLHSKQHYIKLRKLEKEIDSYERRVHMAKIQARRCEEEAKREGANKTELMHRAQQLHHGIQIYGKYIDNLKGAVHSMEESYRLQRKLQHNPTSRWLLRRNYVAQKDMQDSMLALQRIK
jgi:hypothetical protein